MRQSRAVQNLSGEDLRRMEEDAVENALVLEPRLPAVNLAEIVDKGFDPEASAARSRELRIQYWVKLIRAKRKKAREEERRDHLLFPEWDQLPSIIVMPDGKKVPFGKAKYRHARSLVARLRRQFEERLRVMKAKVKEAKLEKPPNLVQAEEWAAKMQRYARSHHGITAEEVASMEDEKPSKKERS